VIPIGMGESLSVRGGDRVEQRRESVRRT